MSQRLNILILFYILTAVYLQNSTKKTLVLLDNWIDVDTHGSFWNQLRKQGFEAVFKLANEENLQFSSYGEYLYDNIIFMASSYDEISRRNKVNIENMLKFIDDGHDIMIFADKDSGKFLRNLVNEFGVDFDDYDSQVKDSLHLYDLKDILHPDLIKSENENIIATKNIINIKNIFTSPSSPILFEGLGMDLDPQSKYVFPILRADSSAYSINSQTGEVYSNGERIKLVVGYQARNNRRVIISGSKEICSDKLYYFSNDNQKFCEELLMWNFQKTGVIKFDNIKHNRNDGVSLDTYRIKDFIEYYVDIYEYDNKNNMWKNYVTDDMQLSFEMMNPYYINKMSRLSNDKPTYFVKFRAPDKHGVFKFIIDYHRTGYSYIISSTKVPLRPYYHNEYERFLPCAYPYYTAVFMLLLGFVVFSLFFLYGKDKPIDILNK